MKSMLLTSCFVCLTLAATSQNVSTEKTYYYFFLSESAIHDNTVGKETILYTEIMAVSLVVNAEEGFFKEKVTAWAQKVNSMCENKDGCSSDVNFYPSHEEADVRQKRIYQRYWNPSRYVMKQVKF